MAARNITEMGAVGRTDLDQLCPALTHHIRDTERTADLDQFATRNDHLAPLGQ